MKVLMKSLLGAVALAGFSLSAYAETTLTIGTVNNGQMIQMQRLTEDFTAKNPDIKLNWVTLEENTLRQKVTTDIATKGGQFDIMTIGTYEVPIWARRAGCSRSTVSARTMTSTICCPPFAPASPSTASSLPRRSTAKARWSCIART